MKATANLSPQEYWDLVHFVQALPYPKMLPEDIRTRSTAIRTRPRFLVRPAN